MTPRAVAKDDDATTVTNDDEHEDQVTLTDDEVWRENGDHEYGERECMQQGATTWHARKCKHCGVEQACVPGTNHAGKARVFSLKPLSPEKLSCPPDETVRQEDDYHIWTQFLTRGEKAQHVRKCIRCRHEQEYRRSKDPTKRGLVLLSPQEVSCPVKEDSAP